MKKYLFGIIAAFTAFLIWQLTEEAGVHQMDGFTQRAFVRNENNTGPVVRIYAVSVVDTAWDEMERYGNLLPHTKYGTTKAFFFPEGERYPESIGLAEPHVAPAFQDACLGVFIKNNMGRVRFVRKPFE